MSSQEEDEELGIKPGVIIDSAKQKYTVINMLGEGGFGAVYKVHQSDDRTREFAMKVEKKIETRKHSKLKMEASLKGDLPSPLTTRSLQIAILKLVGAKRAEKSHFTRIVDRGKKPAYFFLVMQLVGKSLADLKAARPDKVLSIGTGLGVASQCLEAVEDLHQHWFIHRDLKPANFACGLDAQKHVIYILDFGIARRLTNAADELKTPRAVVGFKGTVRFASLCCHSGLEMSKKDDCESWFYLLMDLVQTGLPWRRMSDKNEVKGCKEACRKEGNKHKDELYANTPKCRKELAGILDYIDGLQYHDIPDYSFIYASLKEAGAKCGVKNIDGPFDWELEPPSSSK
ncbi:Protein kinase domain-containing protein [Aphelenchoides fujianensis]|nr:Protein kinase domain-containing protein [Aphelenchoides fujianensis]